jgi:penicillin-binding protein 2
MKINFTNYASRIVIIGFILLAGYGILMLKLWIEQIQQGSQHREKISRQSIRRIREPSLRGRILTSDLRILADNAPAYDAFFYLEEMRRTDRNKTLNHILDTAAYLAKEIKRPAIAKEELVRILNNRPGLPLPVFKYLTREEMSILHEISPGIKGLGIVPRTTRVYPEGSIAAHIIGFTRPEDPVSAEDRDEYSYYIPDLVGKRGVEKAFDIFDVIGNPGVRGMRGIPGYSLVQVDHRGYVYKTMDEGIKPMDGNNIVLTINWKAQKIADSIMRGYKGAFVLLDAETCAVIAMASAPAFDLRNFSPKIFPEYYGNINKDPNKPMLNRATSGVYTPGSILKPLVAMAILNSGISPNKQSVCDGETRIGDSKIKCASWQSGGHGPLTMTGAIENSCNDYFIENGCIAGLDAIFEVLQSAGIGSNTGFCLPDKKGQLPTSEFKERATGYKWNKYDTALLSIGQGIILITPLQAAVYCAAIANGGIIRRPYILKEIRDPFGNLLQFTQPEVKKHLKTTRENLNIIRQGMHLSVNSPHGSGKNAKNEAIDLYGKTGTAEVGPAYNRHKNTWFIGFGSHEDKTYALAILIENGESGGRSCAPLAARFFTEWLSGKQIEAPVDASEDTSDETIPNLEDASPPSDTQNNAEDAEAE